MLARRLGAVLAIAFALIGCTAATEDAIEPAALELALAQPPCAAGELDAMAETAELACIRVSAAAIGALRREAESQHDQRGNAVVCCAGGACCAEGIVTTPEGVIARFGQIEGSSSNPAGAATSPDAAEADGYGTSPQARAGTAQGLATSPD